MQCWVLAERRDLGCHTDLRGPPPGDPGVRSGVADENDGIRCRTEDAGPCGVAGIKAIVFAQSAELVLLLTWRKRRLPPLGGGLTA